MKYVLRILSPVLLSLTSAGAVPLGPELVVNGSFESPRTVGWSADVGWGLDGPPHTGLIGAYTVFPAPGFAYWEQTLSGLTIGSTYWVSFWVANSPFDGPNSNGIEFDFGSTVFNANDLGADYQELTFSHVAAATDELIHISGFNQERAIFLDDVSVREVLPTAAPELDARTVPQGFVLCGLLLLATRRRGYPERRLEGC